ncbi:GGDEF domain-containing protein [Domibacillus antri]|uniref:GGDEF domain-containing protein n=1 Tax=Domibacillus antri TaxID=1714264 RepID=A0A1Q8Q787_9BACI|nr:EAL domain-containing protein [Domibacillus antri]OLN23206.1 GGDEF domain-containing protein [Domibacillus antri]
MKEPDVISSANNINKLVYNYIQEGVMITDTYGYILSVNPAFQVVTGYSEEEVIGKRPNLLRSGVHDEAFYDELWKSIRETGMWHGEIWNRRKNGEIFPEWLTILASKNERGNVEHYVGVFTDITDQKIAEEELRKLAHSDPLTGMANRYHYNVRMESLLETSKKYNQKLAVMFLDLDRFKQINDTFGHEAGDQLLIKVSARIKKLLRNKDLIARLGGDEFVITLTNIHHPREAFTLAENIINTLSAPFIIAGHELYISTSIGISFFSEDGTDADTLLRSADKAMYDSKKAGRNRFSAYHKDMEGQNKELMTMETELRKAIERNEFMVEYQPQINPKSSAVSGAEALLRWNNQHFGNVSPVDFVPVAEETGLIIPIGHWILRQVCRDLKKLDMLGFSELTLAVNVSPLQFSQDNFVDSVRQIIYEENVPARLIDLELTESTVMPDAKTSVRRLTELKNMGFKLSIDDFGTGYSSLSYLNRFPIDHLKIDRNFIHALDHYNDDASIVKAIITMAHRLHLKVVAEGVEKKRQYQFLTDESCDYIQGYYFSKPLPFNELIDFLYMDLTKD